MFRIERAKPLNPARQHISACDTCNEDLVNAAVCSIYRKCEERHFLMYFLHVHIQVFRCARPYLKGFIIPGRL